MPHPYFVPVSPSASRMTQRSGVSGRTSTSYFFPLTSKEIINASSFKVLGSILADPGKDFQTFLPFNVFLSYPHPLHDGTSIKIRRVSLLAFRMSFLSRSILACSPLLIFLLLIDSSPSVI